MRNIANIVWLSYVSNHKISCGSKKKISLRGDHVFKIAWLHVSEVGAVVQLEHDEFNIPQNSFKKCFWRSSAHPNKVSVVPSSPLFSDPINTAGEYRNITERLAETLEDAWIENWFSDAEDIKGPGCRSQQVKRALLPSVFCLFLCLLYELLLVTVTLRLLNMTTQHSAEWKWKIDL